MHCIQCSQVVVVVVVCVVVTERGCVECIQIQSNSISSSGSSSFAAA